MNESVAQSTASESPDEGTSYENVAVEIIKENSTVEDDTHESAVEESASEESTSEESAAEEIIDESGVTTAPVEVGIQAGKKVSLEMKCMQL